MKIANKKHDVIAIKINDPREDQLPNVGLIQLKDAESGQLKWVDTSNPSVRESYQSYSRNMSQQTKQLFKNSGVDTIALQTDQDYIKPLIRFFKNATDETLD